MKKKPSEKSRPRAEILAEIAALPPIRRTYFWNEDSRRGLGDNGELGLGNGEKRSCGTRDPTGGAMGSSRPTGGVGTRRPTTLSL